MREVPFMTSKDFCRYFYPNNKYRIYGQDSLRTVVRLGFAEKFRLADGEVIYFLNRLGMEEATRLANMPQRFDSERGCLYRFTRPRTDKEKPTFVHFPATEVTFSPFKPSKLRSFHFVHSVGMVEFLYLIRRANRVAYSLLLDMVSSKPSSFNIKSLPDILLTNDLLDTQNRVLIEFENSLIWEQSLYNKVQNLAAESAKHFVFLCADDRILKNLTTLLFRIMNPEKKGKGPKRLLSFEAIKTVRERILVGVWRPSYLNHDSLQKLSEVTLFRYSDSGFKPGQWVQKAIDGNLVSDNYGNPIMVFKQGGGGREEVPFVSILNEFQPGFLKRLKEVEIEPTPDSLQVA